MPLGETNPVPEKTPQELHRDVVLAQLYKLPEDTQHIVVSIAGALMDSIRMNGNEGLLAFALAGAELAILMEQAKTKPESKIILLNDMKVAH